MFTVDKLFPKSLWVTTYYSLGSIPLQLIVAFIVAILLNQAIRGLSIFRTLFYLPYITPAVAAAMLWLWLFNPDFGLLNYILSLVYLDLCGYMMRIR